MRTLMVLAILGAASAVPDPAQARFGGAASGAWCLFDDPYTYNCGFATLQQCRATASGAGGQCQPNPSGPPLAETPAQRKREKPRY